VTTAIIGGTGFIGTALVERLLRRRIAPVVISRGKHAVSLPAGAVHETADRMDAPRLVDIFRGHGVDTVIDIFALSMPNTASVFEAMGAVGGRYVLISSVDVYRNYGGLLRKEQPPIQAAPAKEDDPLRSFRYPYRQNARRPKGVEADLFDDYDKIILEEAALGDTRFATTVLRPPMIFGPGDKQRRFAWAIEAVKGGGVIPLDERAAKWPNSYGYIADIAAAIAVAAHDPKAAGRIYNIGQNFVRTPIEWLLTFGVVMGKRIEVETVPADKKGLLWDRAEGSDLRYPLTIDTTRIRKELGFTEPTPELEALRATIADEERRATG
jgi:nucleoside-diphosphate-sugar epimerase